MSGGAPTPLVDLEALMAAVPGGPPAGVEIRYEPIFDEINAARRGADATDTPGAQAAAWARVADLAQQALITRSKHLQLAVWLTEALVHLEGFRGASSGLSVLHQMLERYWEDLHPAAEPDESEPLALRAGVVQWIPARLPQLLKQVPLSDRPAYGLAAWEMSQEGGDAEARQARLADGWPSAEQFQLALRKSTPAFLERTRADLAACLDVLRALESSTDRRLVERRVSGDGQSREYPLLSFLPLRDMLEMAHGFVNGALGVAGSGASAGGGVAAPGDGGAGGTAPGEAGSPGLQEARALVLANQLEGFRLLQARVALAASGRERFLAQLEFGEVCLEARVHTLALPIFTEITALVERRELESWERRDVILRAWRGLQACCELVSDGGPAEAQALLGKATEHIERLSGASGSDASAS